MPNSSASSTSLPKFTTVCCSYFAPTNTDMARALAPTLTASLMPTVIPSFERSSPMIDGPPDTLSTTGTRLSASTQARSTPRVSMSESQCCTSGRTTLAGFSSRSVGPRKYPWSTASITALPPGCRTMSAILRLRPQSMAAGSCPPLNMVRRGRRGRRRPWQRPVRGRALTPCGWQGRKMRQGAQPPRACVFGAGLAARDRRVPGVRRIPSCLRA